MGKRTGLRAGFRNTLVGLLCLVGVNIACPAKAEPVDMEYKSGQLSGSNMNITRNALGSTSWDPGDASWSDTLPNPNPQWSRIFTEPYGDPLNVDDRHTSYKGDFDVFFSLVDQDYTGSGFSSTNDYVTFTGTFANGPYKYELSVWGNGSSNSPYFTDTGMATNNAQTKKFGFSNVTGDTTYAKMKLRHLEAIAATKTGEGTMSPTGIVYVADGDSTNFTATATQPGYRIESILTNGAVAFTNSASDNSITSTNFNYGPVSTNTTNGSVVVNFAPKKYSFDIDSAFGSPTGAGTYNHGTSATSTVERVIDAEPGVKKRVTGYTLEDL